MSWATPPPNVNWPLPHCPAATSASAARLSPKNAAVAELGAELKAGKSTSFGLNYQGQFGRNQDHAGSLFMKVRF